MSEATFTEQVAELERMGLNGAYVAELVKAGAHEASPVAAETIRRGPEYVQQLNKMERTRRVVGAVLREAGKHP